MLVQDIMQSKVITISPETTAADALRLLQARGVRHLPVVESGKLVGLVSDRDLKRVMPAGATSQNRPGPVVALERLPVGEIMASFLITIGPMFPVEEAARLMVSEKISALPVTDAGHLVGIVTETDVLRMILKATGATEPSSRLDVVLKDEPSTLTEVVHTVESSGMKISSVMTLTNRAGAKEATIRVATLNPGPAIRALEAKGYVVRDSWRG